MTVEKLITDHIDIWSSALQTRSTAGRGSTGKIDLYGIKKLRELILELAVRGKLVPQDLNDESASELLRCNEKRKQELAKDGNMKTAANGNINVADYYLETPENWAWIRLGNLAKFIDYRGKTPKKTESGIRLITAKNIKKGFIDINPEEFIAEQDYQSWMTRGFPKKGDILFTTEAPLGNAAIIDLNENFALAQRSICFQWHIPEISSFMLIQILANSFQSQLKDKSTGMTATGIKAAKLKEILVILPPIHEQKKIVTKVQELMSLCDELEQHSLTSLDVHQELVETLVATLTGSKNAEELAENWARISQHFDTLFTTEASIDALKQTILQLAVMGKLVPQDPNDEPASELLKRIEQEKARLIKEGKIKKQKPLPPISDEEKPFELPEGWVWAKVGDILALKNGYAFKSDFYVSSESKYVLTTPGNFYETGGFRYRADKTKYYDGPIDEAFVLSPGDLIIPMTEQAPGLLGSAAFIPDDEHLYLHNQRLGRLEVYYEGVTSDYIFWFFNSQLLRFELARTCTGTTVRHTSPERILNALVPVVPSNEQNRITAKINKLMLLCGILKSRLQSAQQIQLRLTDALTDAS